MDPVNKEQAEKCRDIGAEALRKGDYDRAVKFLSKSIQLHALPGVSSLLSQAEQKRSSVHDAASSSQSQSQSQPQSESQAPRYNRSASSSTSIGADGRSYDESQVALIRKILDAKASGGRQAHYQVLGIPPQADASAIKKAYRKLALQLHPDKNSAPGAEDAFKAIGLAYATLSDEQKRTIYDRYGDEDPDNHGASGGGGGFRRHGGGGVHFQGQEVNPEDIFNAFFGGGMPGGMHMNMGGMPGGFRVYTTGFGGGRGGGFHTRTNPGGGGRPGQQEAPANTAAGLMQLLFQFLPVLLLFAMSFFQFPGEHHTSGHAGGNNYFRLTVSLCLCIYMFRRQYYYIYISIHYNSHSSVPTID